MIGCNRGRLGQDSDKFQQEQVNKIKQPIVDKLKDLSEQQSLQHQYSQNMQTNNQLPGYKDGKPNYGYIEPASWMSNAVPMGIGMIASLDSIFKQRNKVYIHLIFMQQTHMSRQHYKNRLNLGLIHTMPYKKYMIRIILIDI